MAKLFPGPEPAMVMGNMADMDQYGGFSLAFFMPFMDYHISIDRPEALQVVHKKASERPDSTYKVVNYLFKENILFQHGEWQKMLRRSYQEIVNDPGVHAKLQRVAWEFLER